MTASAAGTVWPASLASRSIIRMVSSSSICWDVGVPRCRSRRAARSRESATRKILRSALGKTTVPMSRPSTTTSARRSGCSDFVVDPLPHPLHLRDPRDVVRHLRSTDLLLHRVPIKDRVERCSRGAQLNASRGIEHGLLGPLRDDRSPGAAPPRSPRGIVTRSRRGDTRAFRQPSGR